MTNVVDIHFTPSRAQSAAKARFWAAVEGNPLVDIASLSNAEVSRMAGTTTVVRWASEVPGFMDWMLRKDEVPVLIKSGAELAVKKLLDLVTAPSTGDRGDVPHAVQMAAAKLLLDYSGHAPAQQKNITVQQGQLPEGEQALREYIEAGVKQLKLTGK